MVVLVLKHLHPKTVRQLALQYPQSPLNSGPLLIYLTARDTSRTPSLTSRKARTNLSACSRSTSAFRSLIRELVRVSG